MKLGKLNEQIPIVKRIFLIPVIAIIIGVIGISNISFMTVKEGLLDEMKSNGIHLTERLIGRIEDNKAALKTINKMLDEQIIIGCNMVVANQYELSSYKLKDLSKELGVD